MTIVKQAVILAGGRGTRLKPITNTIPKPMVQLHDKPFLEYLLNLLKRNGIKEVVLLLGYLPEKIQEYFGDGYKHGIKIKYSIQPIEFETGKRLKAAENIIENVFLLLYSDNYLPFNLKSLTEYHTSLNLSATVTIYSNKDKFSKSNIRVDDKGSVTLYDKDRKEKNLSGVEVGYYIINKKPTFSLMPDTNFSFQKEILPQLIQKNQLAGYITDQIYYSIGNLDRLPGTEKFLRPKKVILLDRDGVINKKAPKADYVKNWHEFEFLQGTFEALRLLTKANYKIIIITNQAGIARGIMTENALKSIHNEMIKEIELNDGKIEQIYYCPHGWDDKCKCRKPKPGMLFQASKEHYFDLTKSYFIGDDIRDKEAGESANCNTILIDDKNNLLDITKSILKSENE